MNTINVYCDESCHLEHDRQNIMLFGTVWCPEDRVKEHNKIIKDIKEKHKARGELKWVKVSNSREEYFNEIIDYFFKQGDLNFRCLIVDNKNYLNHADFNHNSHDSFYYKMYFYLIRNIISRSNRYNIFLDIKDTKSQKRIVKLQDVLCNNFYDFDKEIICKIQQIRSQEAELLQLADLLIGALSYLNRDFNTNQTKLNLIERIKEHSKIDLMKSTPPWEEKFNIFYFSPRRTK